VSVDVGLLQSFANVWGSPSNLALDPPIRSVTVRASARPAPGRLADQCDRWADETLRNACTDSRPSSGAPRLNRRWAR